ncbi:transporter substrate-binding domain-containing protein [Erysipelothrix urinaevulpis]|uniref:transporter substrate-binding domain-containing protein n=1 Tax=Erysipelothrix urinaevulpis TaxID=2683717 RepID=UPI001356BEBA|nr:transporter substrate-binding domain-containing protein [Erysipelothrix urinaevulpis]
MKKTLIILFVTLFLTACSSKPEEQSNLYQDILDKKEIVVAVSPDYVPYEFIDPSKQGQDQYVGADIELAKYIAEKLGITLTIKAMDFSDIPSAIALERFDLGISGFTHSEERAKQIQFSDSYDNSESTCQGFLVRKDRADEFKSLKDFEEAHVVVQNGSLQQTYVQQQLPNSKQRPIGKLDDGVLELKYNKVDAVAISCESGASFTLNNDDLMVSDVKFDIIDEEGMMVIMPKEQTELLEHINAIIKEVKENGLYAEWMNDANKLAEDLGAVNE